MQYFGLFTFAALASADINIFRANLSVDSETAGLLEEFAPFPVDDIGVFARCIYDSNWLRTLDNLNRNNCPYVKQMRKCIRNDSCNQGFQFFVENLQEMIDSANEVFPGAEDALAALGGEIGINDQEQAELDALEALNAAKRDCKVRVCDREAAQIKICEDYCNNEKDGCKKCLGECPNTMWKLKQKYNCSGDLSCENLADFNYGAAMGEFYQLLQKYQES